MKVHHVNADDNNRMDVAFNSPGMEDMTSPEMAYLFRLAKNYIQPKGCSIEIIRNLLDTMKLVVRPYGKKRRPRATGKALYVALSLLEKTKSGRSDIVT